MQQGNGLQSPLRPLSVLFFHLLLAHLCTGQSRLIAPSQPIVAKVGDDIILPSHLEPEVDVVAMTLEWTRSDLDPKFVHMRRASQDLARIQHPSYKGRTSVSVDELKHGNVSLKLSRVKPSDAGRYQCYIPKLDTGAFVELVVGAASSLVISLSEIDRNKGAVVLQCNSTGWYPEPEVFWLDAEGILLSAGPTETVRGPDDLYTVSSRVTVEKRHSNSFTCRVQQNHINQTRDTLIHVPDDFFEVLSSSSSTTVGLAVSLAVCILVILILGFFMWRQNKINTKRSRSDETDGEKNQESEELMTEERNQMKSKLKEEQQKLKEEQQRREKAENKVQTLEKEQQKLKEEQQRRQEAETKVQTLEKEQQKLKEEQQRRQEAETKVQTLEKEQQKLKEEQQKLKQEQQRRQEAETKVQTLKKEQQKLKEEQQKLKEEQQRRQEAETKVQSLEKEQQKLKEEQQRRQEAETKVQTLEKEQQKLKEEQQKKTREEQQRRQKAENRVQTLEKELQRREAAENRVKTVKVELETKKTELKQKQADLQQLHEEKQRKEENLQRLKEHLENKNTEVETLAAALTKQSWFSSGSKKEEELQKKEAKKEVEKLKKQLETGEMELVTKTKEIDDKQAEVQQLQEEIQRMETNMKTLMEELESINMKSEKQLLGEKKKSVKAQRVLNDQWENKVKEEKEKREKAEQEVKELKTKTSNQENQEISPSEDVVLEAADPEGKFLRLRNKSARKVLTNCKIEVNKDLVYSFPKGFVLEAGKYVTIWASDGGGNHSPPTDVVWEDQKSWGATDTAVLISAMGERKDLMS